MKLRKPRLQGQTPRKLFRRVISMLIIVLVVIAHGGAYKAE